MNNIKNNLDFGRFPESSSKGDNKDKSNPAIHIYGRRFYKDQTPVEYLIEFLLAFTSKKKIASDDNHAFSFDIDSNLPCYYPEDRVALKLFSFFPNSKLDTRHPAHISTYKKSLEEIENNIIGSNEDKKQAVLLLQSLLTGFSSGFSNRTWVTNCFIPASSGLLSREVNWKNAKINKKTKEEITNWDNSLDNFSNNSRNFMGRGGEVLFLQLSHLFSNDFEYFNSVLDYAKKNEHYQHLAHVEKDLKEKITKSLVSLLRSPSGNVEKIVNFIEGSLSEYNTLTKDTGSPEKASNFGWIPKSYNPEAFLFAYEINNLCSASLNNLEKLELLQTLCIMQVMRTLCFQARRVNADSMDGLQGFIGNYAIITCSLDSAISSKERKSAQRSLGFIEGMLYRAVRNPEILKQMGLKESEVTFKNADDNSLNHFRKFAKELNFIIPRTGGGARFALNQDLLRFLVAALIPPGERIRLDSFYRRVFAHYGIAIGGEQLSTALKWMGDKTQEQYAEQSRSTWVEEALKQGGLLIELSDAVSMVTNPGDQA